jgi:hypothetical protein
VFTARYALSPYIKQTRFVFKGLIRCVWYRMGLSGWSDYSSLDVRNNGFRSMPKALNFVLRKLLELSGTHPVPSVMGTGKHFPAFERPTRAPDYSTLCRIEINPLKTKRNLLYIKTLCVPRSKHFQPRL